jgi:hypothetical protein
MRCSRCEHKRKQREVNVKNSEREPGFQFPEGRYIIRPPSPSDQLTINGPFEIERSAFRSMPKVKIFVKVLLLLQMAGS